MSVAGTALAVGALAKGALTIGFLAGGHDAYFEGVDALGAEWKVDPNHGGQFFDTRQFWTSVAAGLTVAAILATGGAILYTKKGRRP